MFDTLRVTQSDLDLYLTADSIVCRNDPFRVEAISENPLNTFTYIWTLGGYSNDTAASIAPTENNFIEVNLDTATTFYLTALSNKVNECTARDSVSLTVAALDRALVEATADVDTFYRGQLIQLSGRPTSGNISFSWSPTDYMDDPRSTTPQVRPKEATDYIWTVTDNENDACSFSDTVSVRPYEILCDTPEIYLPTAFTPNGDGLNDVLFVEGRNIESMLLIIHDRWGNEVFRSEEQTNGWDGLYKGEQAEMGVYVYQLEVTCPTQEVYTAKGNISKLD
jgi:gliding motility-associated-like protein